MPAALLLETLLRSRGGDSRVNVFLDRRRALDLGPLVGGGHCFRASDFRTAHQLRHALYDELEYVEDPGRLVFDLRGERDAAKRAAVVEVAELAARGTVYRHVGPERRYVHFVGREAPPPAVWLLCSARPDYRRLGGERWRVWSVRELPLSGHAVVCEDGPPRKGAGGGETVLGAWASGEGAGK